MDLAFANGVCRSGMKPIDLAAPFWRLGEVIAADDDFFLLDSARTDARLGRWSFAGGAPLATLAGRLAPGAGRALDLTLTVHREPDGVRPAPPRVLTWRGDPFAAARALLAAYRPLPSRAAGGERCGHASAPPFAGGLVGWFGYGAAWSIEALPRRAGLPVVGAPDLWLMLCDEVLCHEHATGTTTLAATGRGTDEDAARRDLADRHDRWRQLLATLPAGPAGVGAAAAPPASDDRPPDLAGITTDRDETAYRAAVARCREHILAGDAFEICLTQQMSAPLRATPWALYRALRETNPAPFAAFLRAGGVTVVGASPERFLRADATGILESRPIKGTRPRGATPARDEQLRSELAEAEKDNAENTMIVDLVRSDLGRVARIGSVAVPELRIVESYATVHQLVSTVTADLRPDRDALDAVRACFPGGSMTGAPKLEAMAIIEAVEARPRGIYAGALGWLGWDGAMDLCIVIRTFVCADGVAGFGVGGAVTADSDPGAEYRESLDKARALLAALRRAEAEASGGRP